MAKPLKVFRLHSGFYELIVAAPSQKAALAAWGANPREFTQGFAAVTDNPEAIAAARAAPGIVLKRQFGSKGKFSADTASLTTPAAPRMKEAALAKAKREKERAARGAREAERAAARKTEQERLDRLHEIERKQKELDEERRALERPAKQSRSRK